MNRFFSPFLGLAALLLSSCSSTGPGSAPVENRYPASAAPAAPGRMPAAPAAPAIDTGKLQGKALVQELLPPRLTRDRNGWATDIFAAFTNLPLPASAENLCAAMAVIEQESSFQADPEVPGLARIVWQEIETRRQKHLIPKLVLDTALDKRSRNGRSYRQRIDSLRTEGQMNQLYGEIIDEVPGGKLLLSGYNPVRTGGPMQVSIAFAQEHAREKPYGATLARELGGDLRNAVFTRRGGLYFGIAHLLDYPAPYRDHLYRFADFNAGRYSSRNAAFQQALIQLTGQGMDLDGDLLNYSDGRPGTTASATQKAALQLARPLKLSAGEINAGLQQEKREAFSHTPVYQRVFALADSAAGRPLPREVLPHINLKSPKIRSKITTAWFAERVQGRYRLCLKRAADLQAPPPGLI